MAVQKYFFQPEKKVVKQGFFLTDADNNVVYEAKSVKQSLFGPAEMEFVNHISGQSVLHKIGKTVTAERQFGEFTDIFWTKSSFKFDGVRIWDYLHDQGIQIDTGVSDRKLGMTYEVLLNGESIARISTAAADGSSFFVTSPFNFDIFTEEEYLDWAFLTAFSIARTDQMFYD